jgi:hypothetical protein
LLAPGRGQNVGGDTELSPKKIRHRLADAKTNARLFEDLAIPSELSRCEPRRHVLEAMGEIVDEEHEGQLSLRSEPRREIIKPRVLHQGHDDIGLEILERGTELLPSDKAGRSECAQGRSPRREASAVEPIREEGHMNVSAVESFRGRRWKMIRDDAQ